jgi:hypothetical protein
VEAQRIEIAEVRPMLEKKTTQLQKVSERLESITPPARLVDNRWTLNDAICGRGDFYVVRGSTARAERRSISV